LLCHFSYYGVFSLFFLILADAHCDTLLATYNYSDGILLRCYRLTILGKKLFTCFKIVHWFRCAVDMATIWWASQAGRCRQKPSTFFGVSASVLRPQTYSPVCVSYIYWMCHYIVTVSRVFAYSVFKSNEIIFNMGYRYTTMHNTHRKLDIYIEKTNKTSTLFM